MIAAPAYNPLDWHWIVGGDESRYWSSAAGAYVEALPDGAGVTRIATENELADVLAVYGLPGPIVDLASYAAEVRWRTETGGIEVAGMAVHTDDRSKSLILGARLAANIDPAFATQFKVASGFVTLDASAIIMISDAVLAHVADCFAREATVLSAINAGTITTPAEIDAAFATPH